MNRSQRARICRRTKPIAKLVLAQNSAREADFQQPLPSAAAPKGMATHGPAHSGKSRDVVRRVPAGSTYMKPGGTAVPPGPIFDVVSRVCGPFPIMGLRAFTRRRRGLDGRTLGWPIVVAIAPLHCPPDRSQVLRDPSWHQLESRPTSLAPRASCLVAPRPRALASDRTPRTSFRLCGNLPPARQA